MDNGKEKYGYTIDELFEMAVNDSSWEADKDLREVYALMLKNQLMNLT